MTLGTRLMSRLSTVLYNCVSFILLHRLSHVEMVRDENLHIRYPMLTLFVAGSFLIPQLQL